MASASSPSLAASSASSSGCDAPSRNEKLEWQCSSAYGTEPLRRSTVGTNGWRLRDHAGLSPPSASGGTFVGRPSLFRGTGFTTPSLNRRSSSFHGIAGLLNPMRRGYRTLVRLASGTVTETTSTPRREQGILAA